VTNALLLFALLRVAKLAALSCELMLPATELLLLLLLTMLPPRPLDRLVGFIERSVGVTGKEKKRFRFGQYDLDFI